MIGRLLQECAAWWNHTSDVGYAIETNPFLLGPFAMKCEVAFGFLLAEVSLTITVSSKVASVILGFVFQHAPIQSQVSLQRGI